MGATPTQQIIPGVGWAFESLGKRKFYLAGTNSVFSRVASEIIKDELESLGGVVVGEDYFYLPEAPMLAI